jgi:hypothetical protein
MIGLGKKKNKKAKLAGLVIGIDFVINQNCRCKSDWRIDSQCSYL